MPGSSCDGVDAELRAATEPRPPGVALDLQADLDGARAGAHEGREDRPATIADDVDPGPATVVVLELGVQARDQASHGGALRPADHRGAVERGAAEPRGGVGLDAGQVT